MKRCLSLLCLVLLAQCHPGNPAPGSHAWGVRIIYAHAHGRGVDPRLRSLAEQLAQLKTKSVNFTAYQLRDEATFTLEEGSAGRMQLPDRTWLSLIPRGEAADGKQRLEISMDDLQVHAMVAISAGATVAIGGPPYAEGTLIMAVTSL